jgi:hypothetical protein
MRTLGNAIDTTMATKACNSNPVINSAMQVWQRGVNPTWVANNAGNYQADRWLAYSFPSTRSTSRQVTGDTTNLPNIQYCLRYQRTAGATTTDTMTLVQNVESVNSIPYAGKTVTFSFYARKGANYSATSSVLAAILTTGTGTDENYIYPGFTGTANPIIGSATLTTTWQRFSFSGTLASTTTQIAPRFQFDPVGTAGAADYYEVTGIQVDIGSVALPFQTATGTIQGELAACQRYYLRVIPGSFTNFGTGYNSSTTASNLFIAFPVSMRTAPTGVEQTGTAGDYRLASTSATNCTSVPAFNNASTLGSAVQFVATGAGLTSGGAASAQPTNGTAYLGWSAEL